MRRWLHVSGRSEAECAEVAARNRTHARENPRASYANTADPTPLFDPLTKEQAAEPADGCVVLVLAREEKVPAGAVFIDGIGWSQDAPSVESRDWDRAAAAERAAHAAYERSGIDPSDVEVAEVDDTYAYKQLQHLEALGLEGLDPDRVNPSGGALGEGHLREANGLARALACIELLRAGDAHVGVAQSWRGVPSTSSAVAVMRR
jgi:acetyl-CoA C-acetyltransferase